MSKTVICRDMDGNESEVPLSELGWRPAAYGIVIKDDNLLLLKQYNGYDLPGGALDIGETPEQAVLREIQEESGLIAQNPKLITVRTSFFRRSYSKENNAVQSLSIYYVCDYVSGEITNDGHNEHEQQYAPEGCVWLPIKDLPHITVAASTDWRPFVEELV